MNNKIITYITNWDRVNDDVLKKESELKQAGIPIKIVNSTSSNNPGWMNLGSDAWCYRQLFEIMKDATSSDCEYISILFGDIYAPEGTKLEYFIKETRMNLNILPDCYVYSTSFTHDGYSYPPAVLKKFNKDVAWVCGVDSLYITLHKDVYNFLANFLEYFDIKNCIDNFRSGWAVDLTSAIYSIYNGKGVFRNLNSILVHYENSGYDVNTAYNEMNQIVRDAILYMSHILNYDERRLNLIHHMIMTQRTQYVYSYNDFYEVINEN